MSRSNDVPFFYRLICDLSKGYTDIVKLLGSAADRSLSSNWLLKEDIYRAALHFLFLCGHVALSLCVRANVWASLTFRFQ